MAADLAAGLATAMLGGPWERAAIEGRCREAVGRARTPQWLRALTGEVLGYHHRPPLDAPRELAALLVLLPAWVGGERSRRRLRVVHWHPVPTVMRDTAWPVTRLDDLAALARLLDLDAGELAWFADVRSSERAASEPLRHYRLQARVKRGGGVRLLEVPKPRLREIQRRLLRHVIAPIPLHDAAHGCVPGRGVATSLAPHAGNGVVLRFDLADFFGSIAAARVWGVLRSAGYPEAVAHCLTGLVTTATSRSAWAGVAPPTEPTAAAAHRQLGRLLAHPHLPQGAPTSPALANLVAYSLDVRLAGLARSLGCAYTRYVDDLVFSASDLPANLLRRRVPQIVAEEGFRIAAAKTVLLSRSGRQQLLGAVVNDRTSVPRPEYDRLRAVLHNCLAHGAESQNRGLSPDAFRAQLAGRVAWVNGLDPRRGALLRDAFDRIGWPDYAES